MERQLFFKEQPQLIPCGENVHVPINIKEDVESEGYRADIIQNVKQPVTVDSIIEAAINEKYSDEQRKKIMIHFSNQNDKDVKEFNDFVTKISEAARICGYE